MDHAYWGPGFSNDAIGEVLAGAQARMDEQGCSVERVADEGALRGRTVVPQAARRSSDGLIRHSAGMPSPLCRRQIILSVSGRLWLRTS